MSNSIVLSTPPPSPPLHIDWGAGSNNDNNIAVLDLPDALVDVPISPVKRPRAYSAHPRRLKEKKAKQLHTRDNEASPGILVPSQSDEVLQNTEADALGPDFGDSF
ncbi:hypothetical protein H0H92_002069, partial [Tricholoma furcatifolium]